MAKAIKQATANAGANGVETLKVAADTVVDSENKSDTTEATSVDPEQLL